MVVACENYTYQQCTSFSCLGMYLVHWDALMKELSLQLKLLK